jgi:hypothetical protein
MAQEAGEVIGWATPTIQIPPGEGAIYVGCIAADALADLTVEPNWSAGQRRQWIGRDGWSFHECQEIDQAVPHARAELDVSDAAVLSNLLHSFHTALPYSQAEWHWLHEAYYDLPVGPGRWNIIRRQEIQLVSSGLRQVVYGRDLLRRWWAWRRQTDEFQGQGTLDIARGALAGLVENFHPEPRVREELATPRAD